MGIIILFIVVTVLICLSMVPYTYDVGDVINTIFLSAVTGGVITFVFVMLNIGIIGVSDEQQKFHKYDLVPTSQVQKTNNQKKYLIITGKIAEYKPGEKITFIKKENGISKLKTVSSKQVRIKPIDKRKPYVVEVSTYQKVSNWYTRFMGIDFKISDGKKQYYISAPKSEVETIYGLK